MFSTAITALSSDCSTIDWTSPQVTNYKFKQDPGDKNALGLVRLDMSNEHGVYMHDTPMKKLFDQRSRPFSADVCASRRCFSWRNGLRDMSPVGINRDRCAPFLKADRHSIST